MVYAYTQRGLCVIEFDLLMETLAECVTVWHHYDAISNVQKIIERYDAYLCGDNIHR